FTTKALSGPVVGLTVNAPFSTAAQVAAGSEVVGLGAGNPNSAATAAPTGPLRHGTCVLLPCAVSPPAMDCCPAVGAKILLLVSSGTECSASDRRPSWPINRNVLSFFIGKPIVPPNCCRFSPFLIGKPLAVSENWPGFRAGLNANGSRASIASLRKKPYRLACKMLVPDLVAILIEAPLALPNSAE